MTEQSVSAPVHLMHVRNYTSVLPGNKWGKKTDKIERNGQNKLFSFYLSISMENLK